MISLVFVIRMKAVGSFSLMKFRSCVACGRLSAVNIIYLSSPENAPCASTIVALRFKSFLMNSRIGPGLVHTILKYFDRLKLSIKLSIMKERTAKPIQEYKPVLISKIKKLDIAKRTSAYNSAVPILTLVYFLKIAAIISVPPLEVPKLNRTAEAKAGKAIAKQSSNIG